MNVFDLSWMVGKFVTCVRFSDPGQWSFLFEADSGLGVECHWRLLRNGRIVLSDDDHLQKYDQTTALDAASVAMQMLKFRPIKSAQLLPGTADLLLDFDDALRLEIIPFSSAYESWNITLPCGSSLVALGGGELMRF